MKALQKTRFVGVETCWRRTSAAIRRREQSHPESTFVQERAKSWSTPERSVAGSRPLRRFVRDNATDIQSRSFWALSGDDNNISVTQDQQQQQSPPDLLSEEKVLKRIAEICDDTVIPYGEFTPELWQESLTLLERITSFAGLPALESSCEFMERLVIETDNQRIAKGSSNHQNQNQTGPGLTTKALNSVIDCWKKNWDSGAVMDDMTPPQMLNLLDDWLFRLDNSVHPDTKTYGTIIKGAINRHTDVKAARVFIESLFHRMIQESKSKIHPRVRPDKLTYANMIHFFCKIGDISHAERVLDQICLEYAAGYMGTRPSLSMYVSFLCAYAKAAGSKDRDPRCELAERAENMLLQMKQLSDSGTMKHVKPDIESFRYVLKCWAQSIGGHPEAFQRLKCLYEEMSRGKDNSIRPDSRALAIALGACMEVGDGVCAQAFLDHYLAQRGISSSPERESSWQWPRSSMFDLVIAAWQRSGERRSVEKIECLISQMKELYARSGLQYHAPSERSYNTLMLCLVKQGKKWGNIGGRCEAIVKEMEELSIQPSTFTYNTLMDAHATDGKDPYRAEAALERLYEAHLASGKSEKTKPDNWSFNIVLKSWAESGNKNAPERVDGILRRMWKLSESGVIPDAKPNTVSYSTVLSCHAKSIHPSTAMVRCQELLEEMEARGIKPDVRCYASLVRVWTDLGQPEKVEAFLERMYQQYKSGKNDFTPDLKLFYDLLCGVSYRSGGLNAGEKAQQIFDKMQEYAANGFLEKAPDSKIYDRLIQSWVFSGHPRATDNVTAILHDMEAMASAGNQAVAPLTSSYNAVLLQLSKDGRGTSAEALLERMLNMYLHEGNKNAKPCATSFFSVLWAWANSKNPIAPKKSESVFKKMIDLHESGTLASVEPSNKCFNAVLICWTKQGKKATDLDALFQRYERFASSGSYTIVMNYYGALGNLRRAEELLNFMRDQYNQGRMQLCPTSLSYNAVLKALSNSEENDKGERAEALLREMYELHERGDYPERIKPDQHTFTTTMHCYVRSNHPEATARVDALRKEMLERSKNGEQDLEFDQVGFGTLLNAYAQHGQPERADKLLEEQCHEMLQEIESNSKSSNNNSTNDNDNPTITNIRLHSKMFNTVLSCWARSNNAERAEAVLRMMCHVRDKGVENVQPISLNYVTVVDCWNRSDSPLAGERADDVLQMMESDPGIRGVAAGKGLYLEVMKGLARSGQGEKAEALLGRVQTLFRDEKSNTDVDLFLYHETIQAWRQSGHSDAEDRIRKLEEEMSERFPSSKMKQASN